MVEVPVVVDGVQFYVEVTDRTGPTNVGLDDVLTFSGVRQTVEVVSREMVRAWEAVRPDEANVEFSLKLKAKEGKLVGLLAAGEAEGALKVSLRWYRDGPGRGRAEPGEEGETGPPADSATSSWPSVS